MRWEGREESNNVQDKRGMAMPAGGMALGGGLGTIILVIIVMLLGGDPQQLLKQMGAQEQQTSRAPSSSSRSIDPSKDPNAELKSMVSVIFKDTEDVWNKLFRNEFRAPYEEPTLVLFDQPMRSSCGVASITFKINLGFFPRSISCDRTVVKSSLIDYSFGLSYKPITWQEFGLIIFKSKKMFWSEAI